MFCGKCGTQVNDNANVCHNCGNVLNKSITQNLKVKKKISKKTITGIVVLAIIIAIPLIFFSLPSVRIVNNLLDGNCDDAYDLYYKYYKSGKGDFILNKGLLYVAEKCEQDFLNDTIDSYDAFEIIDTIGYFGVDDIEDQIDEIDSSIRQLDSDKDIIITAQEHYNNENYYKALSTFNTLPKDSPLYESVASQIDEVNNLYREKIFETIDSYINDDDINSFNIDNFAFYIRDTVSALNDDELLAEVMDKFYASVDSMLTAYLEDNNYDGAVTNLEALSFYFPNDEKLESMKTELEGSYVNSTLAKAKEDFDKGNYESAVSTVKIAIEQVEDNEALLSKYEEYKAYVPTFINDLEYFTLKGYIRNDGKVADNTNKLYGRGYSIRSDWSDPFGSAEYLLNGKYTTFEGKCGVDFDVRTETETQFFEVYGDGNLLYTSPTFTAGVMPSSFSIDITNVKILKIVYPDSRYSHKMATIFDGKVYNKDKIASANKAEATTEATTTEATTVK